MEFISPSNYISSQKTNMNKHKQSNEVIKICVFNSSKLTTEITEYIINHSSTTVKITSDEDSLCAEILAKQSILKPKLLKQEKNMETSKQLLSKSMKIRQKKMEYKNFTKKIIYTSLLIASIACYAEIAYAKFDIDGGVDAATRPLIEGIKTHWGKGVMLTGASAALFGEGDGRQRAVRAGIAAGAAGAVILGMIALLT